MDNWPAEDTCRGSNKCKGPGAEPGEVEAGVTGAETGVGELTAPVNRLSFLGKNSSQDSVERFQAGNKRFGKYWVVNGIETGGQAGVTVGDGRAEVCILDGWLKHGHWPSPENMCF